VVWPASKIDDVWSAEWRKKGEGWRDGEIERGEKRKVSWGVLCFFFFYVVTNIILQLIKNKLVIYIGNLFKLKYYLN